MNTSYDDEFDIDIFERQRLNELEVLLNDSESTLRGLYYESLALKYYTFSEIPPYEVLLILTIIHSCICAVGYVGNIITCIVIVSNKSLHTTTNIYLFNLAVADLTMMTSGLINYTTASWYPYRAHKRFGMQGCFFFNWISDIAVNVSIMTITAFTIERYLAICHPFLARMVLSMSKAVKLIFLIWLIGILFGYLIFAHREVGYLENEVMPLCVNDDNMRYIVYVESLIFFALPFILVVIMYILIWKKLVDSSKLQKNKGLNKNVEGRSEIQNDDGSNRQIFKMLVTVVTVFFFVWASYHFGRLMLLHIDQLPFSFVESFSHIDLVVQSIYSIVYFLSSAINPVIYNAMSKKFRNASKKVFKCSYICQQEQMKKTKHRRTATETKV